MLLASSRISPVNSAGVAQAALWSAFLFWPRRSPGICRARRSRLHLFLGRRATRLRLFHQGSLPDQPRRAAPVWRNPRRLSSGGAAQYRNPLDFEPLARHRRHQRALTGTLADDSAYSSWAAALCKIAVGFLACAFIVKTPQCGTTLRVVIQLRFRVAR